VPRTGGPVGVGPNGCVSGTTPPAAIDPDVTGRGGRASEGCRRLRRAAVPVVGPAASRPVGTVAAGDRTRQRRCGVHTARPTVAGRGRAGPVLPIRRGDGTTACRRRFVVEHPATRCRIPSRSRHGRSPRSTRRFNERAARR
jgi:hypothetical protein